MNARPPTDRWVRTTLLLSVPFNLVVAVLLLFPASRFGMLLGLPAPVPPLYAALSSMFVAAFGLLYAWMPLQKSLNREMLAFVALCKTAAFVVAQVLWLTSLGSGLTALTAVGDLAFALIWMQWLLATR